MSKTALVMFYLLILLCLALWANHSILAALAMWGGGVTIYLGFHLLRQRQLLDWLLSEGTTKAPDTSGHWAGIFTALISFRNKQLGSQAQLSASLDRFKNAVSVLPDGVVIFNEQQQVEWCNPAAEQQLGIHLERDLWQKLNASIHNAEAVHYLETALFESPLKIASRSQPEIALELKVYTFGAQQKILVCQDISQSEKLDAMRRDFIANVSHELRTPLTVVGGFLETLQDIPNAVADPFKGHLGLMEQQAQRMRNLVDDLLTISRMESNPNPPEDHEIDMAQLIARIVDNAKGLSQRKHHIEADISPDVNLLGAEDEIYSALSNLVTNAIRYTPEGGNINISWGQEKGELVYRVHDSGIGISPEHLGRITERFYRVDKSRSRDTGGTGLGLSIVKRILTRHQARLDIESEIGKGSTFSAIFPAPRAIQKRET